MTISRRKTALVALQLSLLSLTGLNFDFFVVDARSNNSRIRIRSSRIISYSTSNRNINMIVNQQLHTQHQHQHQHHQRQQQRQQLQCSSPTITILEQLRGGDNIAATSATTAISTTATVNSLLQALDIFGTVVFAFSGALKAGKKGMDIIGMMIISCITAVGGGTLRDVLMMGHHHIDSSSSSSSLSSFDPVVFWMRTPLYIEISCITAVLTYYFWPKISKRFGFEDNFICTSDALGLAAFCVVGVQQATKRGLAPTLCVVSGLMTATFGGIIRDVICGEQPRIMYPHRTLYALGPTLGAFVYTILDRSRSFSSRIIMLNSSSITVISFLVAFFVRVLSFNKPWRMPHWNVIINKEGKEEEEQQHKFKD